MPYKQIDQEIIFFEDFGKGIIVPTEKVDEKTGEKIMVEIYQPFYVKTGEVYKLSEFVENMKYDLKVIQEKIDKVDSQKAEIIEEYNKLVGKINEIKKDLPDIGLSDKLALAEEIMK